MAQVVNWAKYTTRLMVELIEQGEQTKVVLTQEGFPDESLSRIISQGTMESLDKLAEILATQFA